MTVAPSRGWQMAESCDPTPSFLVRNALFRRCRRSNSKYLTFLSINWKSKIPVNWTFQLPIFSYFFSQQTAEAISGGYWDLVFPPGHPSPALYQPVPGPFPRPPPLGFPWVKIPGNRVLHPTSDFHRALSSLNFPNSRDRPTGPGYPSA